MIGPMELRDGLPPSVAEIIEFAGMMAEGYGYLKWNEQAMLKADMMNARQRLLSNTSKVPMIAASEVGYRLISLFHSNRAHLVAGIGYNEKLDGLEVVGDGMINVGRGFVAKTTPAAMSKRVAEMGKALDLIANKQKGVIPTT